MLQLQVTVLSGRAFNQKRNCFTAPFQLHVHTGSLGSVERLHAEVLSFFVFVLSILKCK